MRAAGSANGTLPPAPRGLQTSATPLLLGAGLAVVLLAAVGLSLWWRARTVPVPPVPVAVATDALTQELVSKQLRLARAELDDKNYRVAITEAEGVLKLSAGHPDAQAVLSTARERLAELDRSVAEAQRLVEAGDSAGASRELSHVLELDPRHPGAAELTGRLNGMFIAQAEAAASEMRTAREAAARAGAGVEVLRAADASAQRGQELIGRSEFAEATRTFLETRDALDRATRLTAARRATRPALPPATAAPGGSAATPPPSRNFFADPTSVSVSGQSSPAGFDGVAGQAAQFSGRMEFEVLPPAVRPGEPFVVRIHLRNEGRRSVKIRGLALVAVVDGQRVPAAAVPLLKEVKAQSRGLVAEYSGVWNASGPWMLEAVVTADKNETLTSRLRAN